MIRKIFSAMLLMSIMIITPQVAFADYPQNLNGDSNYILCDGHQGYGTYLAKNTLKVLDYSDKGMIICLIKAVTVKDADRGGTQVVNNSGYAFLYELSTRKMGQIDINQNVTWLNPTARSRAEGYNTIRIGNLVFYLATGRDFWTL